MKIKQQYTKQQLEEFPTSRLKRMHLIPRQAKFTKMSLIRKIMGKMEKAYPDVIKASLETHRYQDLRKRFHLPIQKGLTKEKVIEGILEGKYKEK